MASKSRRATAHDGGAGSGRRRRREALDRSMAALSELGRVLTTEEMERVASRLEGALRVQEPRSACGAMHTMPAGESTLSRREQAALEAANLARYFEARRALLRDALSTPEVARLLGTSRQTPHDRVKAGSLLAVREQGGLRFPPWQFDPEGPDGVVAGLPEVIRALSVSPLAKVGWLTRANPYLEGRTPLAAVGEGEVAEVIALARAVGVS